MNPKPKGVSQHKLGIASALTVRVTIRHKAIGESDLLFGSARGVFSHVSAAVVIAVCVCVWLRGREAWVRASVGRWRD